MSAETTETVKLQIETIFENHLIPMETLTGARIDKKVIVCPIMDAFELRLIAYLGEHRVMDKKTVFPTSWWDAVKDQFIPERLKKYFSINYTSIEVKVGELATKWKLPEAYGPWPYMRWDEQSFNSKDDE